MTLVILSFIKRRNDEQGFHECTQDIGSNSNNSYIKRIVFWSSEKLFGPRIRSGRVVIVDIFYLACRIISWLAVVMIDGLHFGKMHCLQHTDYITLNEI